ncbi:MAG: DUF1573 domain-containing protein [Bacteroidota bacterium]
MISVFTYLLALIACPVQPSATDIATEEPKVLEWNKETHDFGNITEGTKAKYTFTFTNTGTEPAVVASAQASCGCTVPSFSKEPVLAGGKGTVTAIFDSSGKTGNQTKTITVTTNVGVYLLYIKCNIVAKVAQPKSPVQLGD